MMYYYQIGNYEPYIYENIYMIAHEDVFDKYVEKYATQEDIRGER